MQIDNIHLVLLAGLMFCVICKSDMSSEKRGIFGTK